MDFNEWNKGIMAEFRANGGKVGGQFEGAPMVIIHTTGAKTGAKRENPLMYLQDGDDVVIFASKAGAPDNPDWYHNLVKNPEVGVELGDETYTAEAVVADPEDRARLYAEMAGRFQNFAEYEKATTRTIPVVRLKRK